MPRKTKAQREEEQRIADAKLWEEAKADAIRLTLEARAEQEREDEEKRIKEKQAKERAERVFFRATGHRL